MIEVESAAAMQQYVGRELAKSDWTLIDQDRIDTFAKVTGDFQWIHVDVERARTSMPDGKTIAHGYLILSLVAGLNSQTFRIVKKSRAINYGSNKVRFITPVQAGARVRLVINVKAVEPVQGGHRVFFEQVIQIEGKDRPAMVAETISQVYD